MKIVIDPGHGLPDPGAVGFSGSLEHKVALVAANYLRTTLEEAKHTISLTRLTEKALDKVKEVDLAKRCSIANNLHADCFISIHCNASINRSASGWEIIHDAQSTRAKNLAQRIFDSVRSMNVVLSPGESKLSSPLELQARGVKTDSLYVLRHTTMPAVLIELGFLSNPEEEKLLLSYTWLQHHMIAVADGITKWGRSR